ncbi:MAG: M48 family metallopeptidase [Paracoccaceae bacterium]
MAARRRVTVPDHAVLARYFDGRSARPREVTVRFGERSLVIIGRNGDAEAHWPLATLRALGDSGDAAAQLTPDRDSDERLVIRDAQMLRAIERLCPNLRHRPIDRRKAGRAAFWSVAAMGSVLALVFVIIPALAGQLAPLIPAERERQLGNIILDDLREFSPLFPGDKPAFCRSEKGIVALNRMTERLIASVEMPYPPAVSVLDVGRVNAFALPGGQVVILRGLIDRAGSPEEVAGVLAHEFGHVIHRDPMVGVLKAMGSAGILGLMVGDVFGATIVVAATEALANANYSRDVERRADETAYQILLDAGLPTAPFAGFFRRLQERYGDGAGVLNYLSSHPALSGRAERASQADEIGDGPYTPVLTDREWVALQGICADQSDTAPN